MTYFFKYMFRGFILYLLVIPFAIFSHLWAPFYNLCENKHDDPLFFFFKMIADILAYIISKSGTLFNFGNFLTGFFSCELKFQKIMKKFSATISVIKYTMRHIL